MTELEKAILFEKVRNNPQYPYVVAFGVISAIVDSYCKTDEEKIKEIQHIIAVTKAEINASIESDD
jgi:uncharacterized membrane protein (DUF106 family)